MFKEHEFKVKVVQKRINRKFAIKKHTHTHTKKGLASTQI